MNIIELGIFDIDGTVRTKFEQIQANGQKKEIKGIPEEVKAGFRHLWEENNILTTVLTGRGYLRMRETLGDEFPNLISPDKNLKITPLGLENSARITNRKGKNIKYHPLKKDELISVLSQVDKNTGEIEFVAYYPKKEDERPVIWVPDAEKKEHYLRTYGYFAEISGIPINELEKRMKQEEPCMFMIRPQTMSSDLHTVFKGANIVINEGEYNIMTQGINKGSGINDISEITDIPLVNTLFAGNDDNDRAAFNMPVGLKIVVGDTLANDYRREKNVVLVPSPQALGEFLLTI